MMAERRDAPALKASSARGSTGLVVAVVATVIGGLILAALLTNEQIERRTADAFLREYYQQVVQDRDTAWSMLTPEFRSSGKIRGGSKTYDVFFGKFKEVRVSQVDKVSGDPNWFVTSLTYVSRKGRASPPEWTRFQLACSLWVNKNPFMNCKPKHIEISDTSYERIR
jgi:hypothetical protein